MNPSEPPVTISEAFANDLREYGAESPKTDFSLEQAAELVRADRDGRSTK